VILPAHNSAGIIQNTINELAEFFREKAFNGQVVIVENGSRDNTWEVMSLINRDSLPFDLVLRRSNKGLGNAIREGLSQVTTDFVLITADDLPFGFSDITGYLDVIGSYDVAVGSKAHPQTEGERSLGREFISRIFRTIRRIVIGVNLGDTQGSILGRSAIICSVALKTSQENYLISTEIVAIATSEKFPVIELPVQFRRALRKSNINIIDDSIKMLRGLFEIRRNLKST